MMSSLVIGLLVLGLVLLVFGIVKKLLFVAIIAIVLLILSSMGLFSIWSMLGL